LWTEFEASRAVVSFALSTRGAVIGACEIEGGGGNVDERRTAGREEAEKATMEGVDS